MTRTELFIHVETEDAAATTEERAEGARWGPGDLHLKNLATWGRCTLDSVVKVIGSTCVFDHDLWGRRQKIRPKRN